MAELVGLQTMLILNPYYMLFHAVVVSSLELDFLLKSCSAYCVILLKEEKNLRHIYGLLESSFSLLLLLKPNIYVRGSMDTYLFDVSNSAHILDSQKNNDCL